MHAVLRSVAVVGLALGLGPGLVACGQGTMPEFTVFDPKDQRERERHGTFQGTDGVTLFSTEKRPPSAVGGDGGGGGGIGVNAFLWQSTLETLDFLPIASADPWGGLIITDWYQPAESPDERLKLQVLISDRMLRADALKVSVFRQVAAGNGGWLDATVDAETAKAIEDRILTRARELRVAAVQSSG